MSKLENCMASIANFYFNQSYSELYQKTPNSSNHDFLAALAVKTACERVVELQIHEITLDEVENKLTISLARPGLLIGRHGKNINDLSERLKVEAGVESVHIEETETVTGKILYYLNYHLPCSLMF